MSAKKVFELDIESITGKVVSNKDILPLLEVLSDKVAAPHMMIRTNLPPNLSDAKMTGLRTWLDSVGGYIDGDEFVFPVEVKL